VTWRFVVGVAAAFALVGSAASLWLDEMEQQAVGPYQRRENVSCVCRETNP
jgi:hypothetical protein